MMAYAVHICSSGTYHHRHVTLGTAKAYLAAAATMISDSCGHDPRKYTPSSPSFAPELVAVFTEYQRWESMPDRREPWTPELQLNLDVHLSSLNHAPDSLPSAIADFTAAGLQVGYRVSEYAQSDPSHGHLDCHARDPLTREALAFTLADITFYHQKHPIPLPSLLSPSIEAAVLLISRVELNFSTQKNQVRNEKQDYIPNNTEPRLCVVCRFLHIIRRFVSLVGLRYNIPLSIYRSPSGLIKNIVRTDIDKVLQHTAQRVFHLDLSVPKHKAIIRKWTTHSLRVGACNILYGMGTPSHEIQHRLRWRSLSFMAYFRNLSVLSSRQNLAVNTALAQPDSFF
jgi:hypothetical protein